MPGRLGRPGRRRPGRRRRLDHFGRVDTLINNAGIFIAKPFVDYTDEDYDADVWSQLEGLLRGVPQRDGGDAVPGRAGATW